MDSAAIKALLVRILAAVCTYGLGTALITRLLPQEARDWIAANMPDVAAYLAGLVLIAAGAAWGWIQHKRNATTNQAIGAGTDVAKMPASPPTVLLLLCLLPLVGGCMTAGTSADLLSYDVISSAAVEAAKGVENFDTAIKTDQAKTQAAMLVALKASIVEAKGDPALADRVIVAMTTHLANLTEQERRRATLKETTLDNLTFIQEVCKRSKDFVVYRSDVSSQWKAYISTLEKGTSAKGTVTP